MCLSFAGARSKIKLGMCHDEKVQKLTMTECFVKLCFSIFVYLAAIFVRPTAYLAKEGRVMILLDSTTESNLTQVRRLIQRLQKRDGAASDVIVVSFGGRNQEGGIFYSFLDTGVKVEKLAISTEAHGSLGIWFSKVLCCARAASDAVSCHRPETIVSFGMPLGYLLASCHRFNNACDSPWRLINVTKSARVQHMFSDSLCSHLHSTACATLPLRLTTRSAGDDAAVDLSAVPSSSLDHLLGGNRNGLVFGRNFPWLSASSPSLRPADEAQPAPNSLWMSLQRPKVWSNIAFFLPLAMTSTAADIPSWALILMACMGACSTAYHLAQTTVWYRHAWMVADHAGAATAALTHAWSVSRGDARVSALSAALLLAAAAAFLQADRGYLSSSARARLANEVLHSLFHLLACGAICSLWPSRDIQSS